jgi:Arm DNA-binding domain
MARQTQILTALQVERLNETGIHFDGEGLYLQVTGAGSKSWIYRYTFKGKVRSSGGAMLLWLSVTPTASIRMKRVFASARPTNSSRRATGSPSRTLRDGHRSLIAPYLRDGMPSCPLRPSLIRRTTARVCYETSTLPSPVEYPDFLAESR